MYAVLTLILMCKFHVSSLSIVMVSFSAKLVLVLRRLNAVRPTFFLIFHEKYHLGFIWTNRQSLFFTQCIDSIQNSLHSFEEHALILSFWQDDKFICVSYFVNVVNIAEAVIEGV